MDAQDLNRIRDIAGQMLGNATFAGLDHAERVWQIAEDVGQREGADLDILHTSPSPQEIST